MQPTGAKSSNVVLEERHAWDEPARQGQQMRLLSLVESAETKLKRQKQQQQKQLEDGLAANKTDASPQHANQPREANQCEFIDGANTLQVNQKRKQSLSLSWQMKSPAFVTLNEGELERLAIDEDGSNPHVNRRRSSSSSSTARSLRSQQMSSCATGGGGGGGDGGLSKSPPVPVSSGANKRQREPAVEHEQHEQRPNGVRADGDKLDRDDIGRRLSQRGQDYGRQTGELACESALLMADCGRVAQSGGRAEWPLGALIGAERQPNEELRASARQRRLDDDDDDDESAVQANLTLAEGRQEAKNDNENGRLSDCATRERRKSKSGPGLVGAANDDITAAAAARQQQARREHDEQDDESGQDDWLGLAAEFDRDVDELGESQRRGRVAKNMTNRPPRTTTAQNDQGEPAETTMNTSGDSKQASLLSAETKTKTKTRTTPGQDKDKIDGAGLVKDDGEKSVSVGRMQASFGERQQQQEEGQMKLNGDACRLDECRKGLELADSVLHADNGERRLVAGRLVGPGDEGGQAALMLQKSVNDYGRRRELSAAACGDLLMENHHHRHHPANKNDYQQTQLDIGVAAQQRRHPNVGDDEADQADQADQQQQQPTANSQRDDRGGPTPTNDLVRTLLQRDRRAFGLARGKLAEDVQDGQRRHWSHRFQSNGGPPQTVQVAGAGPFEARRIAQSDNDDTRRKLSAPTVTTMAARQPAQATTGLNNGKQASERHYSELNSRNSSNNGSLKHRLRDDAIEMNARRHSSVLDLDFNSLMISAKSNCGLKDNKSRHQHRNQRERRPSGSGALNSPVVTAVSSNVSESPLSLAAKAIKSMQAAATAASNSGSCLALSSSSGSSTSSSSCSSSSAATANNNKNNPLLSRSGQANQAQFNKCLDFTSAIKRRALVQCKQNDIFGLAPTTTTPRRGQQQPSQARRHSTYMLPLLLLNRRHESSTESDDEQDDEQDDDDDEDGDFGQRVRKRENGTESGKANRLTSADYDISTTASDKNKRRRQAVKKSDQRTMNGHESSGASSPLTLAGTDNDDDGDELSSLRNHRHAKHHRHLPTSASSPSALSTPTNELGQGGGGCGGPCCSEQEQLVKLATENALLSRQLFSNNNNLDTGHNHHAKPAFNRDELGQFEGLFSDSNGLAPIEPGCWPAANKPNGDRRDNALTASKHKQQQVISRHRTGSNPLDRGCKTGPHQHQVVRLFRRTQQQQQQPGVANKPSNWAGKRHSIINLLAGSSASSTAANQASGIVSGGSLNKRRSFAACGSGLTLRNNNETMNNRQKARRLTSGGELTSGTTGCGHYLTSNQCGLMMMRPSESNSSQRGNLNYGTNGVYDPLIPESGFKIVVMGTSGSGKTAIIQRFLYGTFSSRHMPTVEDTYFIEFPHKKNTINISVSDTSGTYQFPAMKRLAINSGDAFILVYSVDDPQSFDNLEQLRQTILDEREQAYLDSIAVSDSSSTSSSTSALTSLGTCGGRNGTAVTGTGQASQLISSLASNCNNSNNNGQQPNQLQPNQGSINSTGTSASNGGLPSQVLSPSRHWSLASLFGGHNHQNHNSNSSNGGSGPNFLQQQRQMTGQQQQQQQGVAAAASLQLQTGQLHATNHHSSIGSSLCSTGTSSCSSSADNSRRSSISAAEAALKTRRTRKPPMVVVANKHDLPDDQHLVNSDEIEALAVIDWNNGFVRASAALNWNIDEIFQQVLIQARQPPTLAEAIVSKRRKSLPPKLPHP